MFVIGLTGSIAMGKSTTARLFAEAGVPVYDADAEVHRLYGATRCRSIEATFPGTTGTARSIGGARRARVGRPAALRRLEAIVHPLVREAEGRSCGSEAGAPGGGARHPAAVRDRRGQARRRGRGGDGAGGGATRPGDGPGMTQQRFEAMLARQMPDAEKRRRADFLVDTLAGTRRRARAGPGFPGRRLPQCRRGGNAAISTRTELSMREIVFDTETTGLDPDGAPDGRDRLHRAGQPLPHRPAFHAYFNPERAMPVEAFKVHGLDEFLGDKKLFPRDRATS